jgi:hypothetical protein
MAGKADDARRRKGVRRGRERGCWLYVSEQQLAQAGWTRDDPPPYAQVWVDPHRPRLMVNLYREP